MNLLFALCIAAPVALVLLSAFSGGGRANKAQQERFEARRAERAAAEKAAEATVVPLPTPDDVAPARGDAAA